MVAQVSDEFGDHTCWSSNIVCVIEAPVLSSSSFRKYIISENDYKKITEAYDKLII